MTDTEVQDYWRNATEDTFRPTSWVTEDTDWSEGWE